jgi:hypothetical protein
MISNGFFKDYLNNFAPAAAFQAAAVIGCAAASDHHPEPGSRSLD